MSELDLTEAVAQAMLDRHNARLADLAEVPRAAWLGHAEAAIAVTRERIAATIEAALGEPHPALARWEHGMQRAARIARGPASPEAAARIARGAPGTRIEAL